MALITQKIDWDVPMVSPECFEEFRCKGGACRNTCCQGWRIDISRGEYNKIRSLCERSKTLAPMKDKFFERVPRKKSTDEQYAIVKFAKNGYCPMFTEGGLCGLQVECGYSVLPKICKVYPRYELLINRQEFVRALDLSCEHTLELLWARTASPLRFVQQDTPTNSRCSNLHPANFAESASDIRNLCIQLMQNRSYPLSDRMILLGLALRELHELSQTETPEEQLPAWFARYLPLTKGNSMTDSLQTITGDQQKFVINNLRFFRIFYRYTSLHPLIDPMRNTIGLELDDEHYAYDMKSYAKARETVYQSFPTLEHFFEHCLVMLMFKDTFPLTQNNIWKHYMYLCNVYSLMQFTSTASIPASPEELIDNLVLLFRTTTSSLYEFSYLSEFMKLTESDSLAHLAILVRG